MNTTKAASEQPEIRLPWWHDRPCDEWPAEAKAAYTLCAIAAERRLARLQAREAAPKTA